MIFWIIKLIKECVIFSKRKRDISLCKQSCLTCKHWNDCKFIEDIDGIQSAMADGYNYGYKEGCDNIAKGV